MLDGGEEEGRRANCVGSMGMMARVSPSTYTRRKACMTQEEGGEVTGTLIRRYGEVRVPAWGLTAALSCIDLARAMGGK